MVGVAGERRKEAAVRIFLRITYHFVFSESVVAAEMPVRSVIRTTDAGFRGGHENKTKWTRGANNEWPLARVL